MSVRSMKTVGWLVVGVAFYCLMPQVTFGDPCACYAPNVGFGDGSDGDWVVSSGTQVLSPDMNYRNVTVSSGATLDTQGRVLRVCGTLTVSSGSTITDTLNGGPAGSAAQGGMGGFGCIPHSAASSGAGRNPGYGGTCSGGGRGGDSGGGGGGGGGAWNVCCSWVGCTPGGDGGSGGDGGRGGGCVTIWAYVLNNQGTIQADGLPGATGAPGENGSYDVYVCDLLNRDQLSGGGGGGGGGNGGNGGTVTIHYVDRPSAGNAHATGGPGGAGGARGVQVGVCPQQYDTYGACQKAEYGGTGGGNGGHGGESDIAINCNNIAVAGNPGTAGATVAVSWVPQVPDINCEDLSGYGYPSVCVGQYVDHTWTVTNEGDAPLILLGISVTGTHASQFLCQTGCGSDITLCPGESRTVTVRFQPTSVGAKSATLHITSNDPDENPCDKPLSGTGAAPDINCEDLTGFDFGSVCIGQYLEHCWTVTNEGTCTLTGDISVTGTGASQFTCQSGCGAFSLSAGQSRTVCIRFQPTSVGAKSATLHITSNDPDENPCDNTLSGTGAAPDINCEDLAPFNYGLVCPGQSACHTWTVTNEGTCTLTGNISITGTDASQFSCQTGCGAFSLNAGQSRTVTICFEPTSPGTKTVTLHITSNDSDENPCDKALSGTGDPSCPGACCIAGKCREPMTLPECTALGGDFHDACSPPPLPVCLGDSNCDRHVDWRDIDYFVAAMNGETAWRNMFLPDEPCCPYANNDCNGDGVVNWRDIDPFVARMGAVCP